VRRIDEIKRKQCADNQLRTVYEKYTRDVRYATYKTLGPHPVVMGHNKDDCLENILQNIGSCQKYDNLSGMDMLVVQDGIPFFRPLLDVSKNDIVAYAREHQIPFLPNSTPPTMKRGQIRNKVVPVLNDWNDLFIPGLFQLGKTMTDMHKVVEKSVEMFVEKFDANHVARVDKSFLEMGENFWKMSLKKLFPTESISNKMIVSLMETFAKCSDFSKFEINKNIQMLIRIDSNVMMVEFKLRNL
jgi:tRNA(Ile)-lysidine synthase TilS/MesJ